MLGTLSDQKQAQDETYQQKIFLIHQKESQDKMAVEAEMEQLRKEQLSELQKELQQKRLRQLSESEKKLEAFKRKQGKGNPENDLIFAEMLAQYGNQVKTIDSDLEREKVKQLDSLE